jgi:hypothetical protein
MIQVDPSLHYDDNCQLHMSRYDKEVRPILHQAQIQGHLALSAQYLGPM